MSTGSRSSKNKKLSNLRQTGFDFGEEPPRSEVAAGPVNFLRSERDGLVIGRVPVDVYLRNNGQGWIANLADLIDELDLSKFVAAYPGGGRAPFHPSVQLGLIIYGLSCGKSSLRELEALAVKDVGAWWICHGHQPDFTTLSRFVSRHVDRLGAEFFVQVTQGLIKRLGRAVSEVAGDGTVIESAASRFGTMTEEAARTRAAHRAAQAKLEGSTAREEQAEHLEKVADTAAERTAKRKAKGHKNPTAKVAPSDPDAVIQKQKNGTMRPSYKPSVLATPDRLVVALYVHASNEVQAIEPMLEQCDLVLGSPVPTLMLDAGYYSEPVLQLALKRELDLLCPAGSFDKTGDVRKCNHTTKLSKDDFRYDSSRDVYVCPEGAVLSQISRGPDRHDVARAKYRAHADTCMTCPSRARCTTAKDGRTVSRYEIDDVKDDMLTVMSHPSAQARYRKRQASVEPVFGDLRHHGLTRFRRRGLKKVRAEFCLHVLAYNLRRTALLQGRLYVFFVCVRLHGGSWRSICAAVAITRC